MNALNFFLKRITNSNFKFFKIIEIIDCGNILKI